MPNKYKSSATVIPFEQAVGKVIPHDITEIRPGQFKGPAFKKGHIVQEKDLPHLRRLGKENLVYGTSVLPGAMLLYGQIGDIPVLGLPACVLFYRATVFDLVLPRVLAGEQITKKDLAVMAHGGLCLNCEQCHYPVCPFGK